MTEIDGIPGQWYKISDNIVPFPFVPVLVAIDIFFDGNIKTYEGFRTSDENIWRIAVIDKKGDIHTIATSSQRMMGAKENVAWMRVPEYKEV